jgi:hypothetical protein
MHWFTPTGSGLELREWALSKEEWYDVIRQAKAYRPGPGFVVDVQQGYNYPELPIVEPTHCAGRSYENLQFMPPASPESLECWAAACGLLVTNADTGGFMFGPGGMREFAFARPKPGARYLIGGNLAGCPVADILEPDQDQSMICAYYRVPQDATIQVGAGV